MTYLLIILAATFLGWHLHSRSLKARLLQREQELRHLESSYGSLESSLNRRGRRLDVLFSSINEAVMRVDHAGRVLAANEKARKLFDIDERLPLPQSMLMFYRNPDWLVAFRQALTSMPDSSSLPELTLLDYTLVPKLASLGKDQALLIFFDITDQKRLEAQRKSLFASLMHDLKTPLTSMLGYARSIETFDDEPELRKEAARTIAEEARRINQLLDALLTLEKLGQIPVDPEAHCDLLDAWGEASDSCASSMDEKDIQLDFQLPDNVPELAMAHQDLERILVNILENALRHSPDKGTLFIHSERRGSRLMFELTDQGTGVAEHELGKLTERFYRGDEARNRKHGEGHGLGLAIVQELCRKYHGDLEIRNHPQYGLSVRLWLPVHDTMKAKKP